MVDVALNLDVSAHNNISSEERSLDQALLSLEPFDANQQINGINATTNVSVAELPTNIRDSFNVAAKQLTLLRESVLSPTAEEDENSVENLGEDEDETVSNIAEPCLDQNIGKTKIFIR